MIPGIPSRLAGTLPILALAVTLYAVPAGAFDETRLERLFHLMDGDGDGNITRPEYQTGRGIVFATLDANLDFVLTEDELRLTPESFRMVAGDDGRIDGMEFLSAEAAAFETIDSNQDLAITYPELRSFIAQHAR
jgi:Ca2+-binding EF-hand superfamily protein